MEKGRGIIFGLFFPFRIHFWVLKFKVKSVQCNYDRIQIIDYKFGFGGEFGVDAASIDALAMSWEYFETSQKRVSQKGKIAGDHYLYCSRMSWSV